MEKPMEQTRTVARQMEDVPVGAEEAEDAPPLTDRRQKAGKSPRHSVETLDGK